MAVSAPDSLSQIPGFRDRLGERVIIPQHSGALLEYLYFCDALAQAPFFAQALKDRVARLSTFRHSSYCRVRRVQQAAERGGQPALVSAHVAGRRLGEILDVALRAELKPSTSGVLAVVRQLMASVALLHDYAPDGFHAAVGPERIVLAGDGRIALAEHVLGQVVMEAAAAWGVPRLWEEFGLAVLPDPRSEGWARRVDIVQVGLVCLAALLGRPLSASEYPHGLERLLGELDETTPEGTHGPLRAPLRAWLERALALRGDSSFKTLLEAQKAFNQLLQDEGYAASTVAWEAFVGVCETAALRVPVVVVVPERVEPLSQDPLVPVQASRVLEANGSQDAGSGGAALLAAATPALVESEPALSFPQLSDEQRAGESVDAVTRLREDPFGPWPVAVPAGSAATLLETFEPPSPPPTGAAALAAVPDAQPDATLPSWSLPPAGGEGSPGSKPVTLFEAALSPSAVPSPAPPPVSSVLEGTWEGARTTKPTSVADWRTRERSSDRSGLVIEEEAQEDAGETWREERLVANERAERRSRRTRIAILVGLLFLTTVGALFAPLLWQIVYEGRLSMGTLDLTSDPPGATVTIDGQVRGHTPIQLRVKAGEHTLEAQVGGSAKSMRFKIDAHATVTQRMTFPEAGERGGLSITTYPVKGKVSIDGVARGEAPIKVTDLQPGTHTLLIQTQYGAQEQDVVVQPGRVSELSVPTVSWVKVTSPFELSVFEDNRLLGTTGSAPVMVAPGRRNLDFVNKALGVKLRQFVDAVPGQVVTVPLALPTGMLNLYANEPAEVLVDGNAVGQTPLPSLQVPLGAHEVVFRHPKYAEVRYAIEVTLTAPVKLNVTFKK